MTYRVSLFPVNGIIHDKLFNDFVYGRFSTVKKGIIQLLPCRTIDAVRARCVCNHKLDESHFVEHSDSGGMRRSSELRLNSSAPVSSASMMRRSYIESNQRFEE